jgi:hypothetical protein
MIVRFTTKHGQLMLLGDSAATLLKLGGHSGTVPGAVLAADLPEFLRRLRAGLASHGDEPSPAQPQRVPPDDHGREGDTEPPAPVTLRMRAAPCIEMIETAIERGSDLMWERG